MTQPRKTQIVAMYLTLGLIIALGLALGGCSYWLWEMVVRLQ